MFRQAYVAISNSPLFVVVCSDNTILVDTISVNETKAKLKAVKSLGIDTTWVELQKEGYYIQTVFLCELLK